MEIFISIKCQDSLFKAWVGCQGWDNRQQHMCRCRYFCPIHKTLFFPLCRNAHDDLISAPADQHRTVSDEGRASSPGFPDLPTNIGEFSRTWSRSSTPRGWPRGRRCRLPPPLRKPSVKRNFDKGAEQKGSLASSGQCLQILRTAQTFHWHGKYMVHIGVNNWQWGVCFTQLIAWFLSF